MKEINCIGQRCPLPIIASAKAVAELGDGESFLLLADDPATSADLKAWSRMTGHIAISSGKDLFTITKKLSD